MRETVLDISPLSTACTTLCGGRLLRGRMGRGRAPCKSFGCLDRCSGIGCCCMGCFLFLYTKDKSVPSNSMYLIDIGRCCASASRELCICLHRLCHTNVHTRVLVRCSMPS